MKKLISILSLVALLLPGTSSAYTVQKGDTLWDLYGSNWRTVAAQNGITDPTKLQIGQVINEDTNLGATPLPVDDYDTFLTSPLGSSATTTFVNELPGVSSSVYTIFGSDGVTPREKIYCAGTQASPKALTNCVRGLSFSPLNGVIDETPGTGLTHSKNARIAVTDNINFSGKALAMLYGFMTSSLKSTDANPFIFVNHPTGPATDATNPLQYITLGQLTSVTSTGCANASETVRGCVEQATSGEVTAGTATGATGANLFVPATQWLDHADENITNNIDAGETLTAYNILYVSSTGKHMIAHGNVQTELDKIDAVAFEGGCAGCFPKALLTGSLVFDSGLSMVTGSLVYVSDAGRASTTPGTIRKVIGVAYGPNTWQFNPMREQTQVNPASSTQYTIPILNASSTLRGWSGAFGGDGSDGTLNVTSGTTTISLATTNIVVKQYTSINISAGAVLTFSNPPTNGSLIILKSRSSCTIAGTINASGFGANTSTRAFGLLEATAAYNTAVQNTNTEYANLDYKLWANKTALAMGSGGEGSATASSSGRGGANLRIECADSIVFTGTINVNGATGATGAAATATSGGARGGGAGGGGGSFLGLANRILTNSGTVTFAGGTGGTGGAGICSTNAAADGGGSAGAIGGGAFLGAGGASGAGGTGGGGSVYASCSPTAAGAGGASNGAAGAAGGANGGSGGAGTFYYGGAGGGGGAGHGGFSAGWQRNYWFN